MKIFWIDPLVHSDDYQEYVELFKQEDKSAQDGNQTEKVAKKNYDTEYLPFEAYDTFEEAIKEINETVKAIVVTSGSYAETLVPKLGSHKNVISMNVFCMDHEVQKVQQLKDKYANVQFINDEFEIFYQEVKDSFKRAMAFGPTLAFTTAEKKKLDKEIQL